MDEHRASTSATLATIDSGSAQRPTVLARGGVALLIGGGVLLAFAAMAAMVGLVVRLARESNREVVVTAHRDPESLREESTTVFRRYNATEAAADLSEAERGEREAIRALFDDVQKCVAESDHDEFRRLVDFDQFMKRVEITGNLAGWTSFERRSWRNEMRGAAEVESNWAEIVIAGIVTPADDPNTRIVYAYTSEPSDDAESRFWISRDGDTWKLYDWARLEHGLAESQRWALYAKYVNTRFNDGLERWGELLGEADAAIASGETDLAESKLRQAEMQSISPELHDLYLVYTGYRWISLDKLQDAERCFSSVSQPEYVPGAYAGLVGCFRSTNPEQALKFARLYEDAIGPSPHMLATQAALLQELGRDEEAITEWRRLVRIDPDHPEALSQVITALPDDDEDVFFEQLDELNLPAGSVGGIANALSYGEYDRVKLLAKWANRKFPNSAGALYVTGMKAYLEGRFSDAAELYRQAYAKETDESRRQSLVGDYVDAMLLDGRVLEALRQAPDQKQAFTWLYDNYHEGAVTLTDDEYRQFVELNLELHPTDLTAVDGYAARAVEEERYAEAERIVREALEATRAEVSESEADEDYSRDACELWLTTAMYHQGRWREAYTSADDQSEAFERLARLAADDERWDLLRELIDMHRRNNGSDPKLSGFEGEMAVHEKRWGDAVHLLRKAQGEPPYYHWRWRHLLVGAYVDSNRWLEHFGTSDNQEETFRLLTNRFIDDENWDAVRQLIEAYRKQVPGNLVILQQEEALAWRRKDYAAYVRLAETLLQHHKDELEGYELLVLKNRTFSALLHSGELARAREFALGLTADEGGDAKLVVLEAWAGDLPEAQRLAMELVERRDGPYKLYSDRNAASLFYGKEFAELHERFPPPLRDDAVNLIAVFVYDSPRRLTSEDVSHAVQKAGITAANSVIPIETSMERPIDAFVVQHEEARFWIAAGGGKFNETWSLDKKSSSLREPFDRGSGWIAVGACGINEAIREKADVAARRIAVELIGEGSTVAVVRGQQSWQLSVFPVTADWVQAWRSTGKAPRTAEEEVSVTGNDALNAGVDREYLRKLHAVARKFEDSVGGRLEVLACVSKSPHLDPVRLQVHSIERNAGSLSFEGTLVSDSVLLPELQSGLTMVVHAHQVQEIQLNDEPPLRRPVAVRDRDSSTAN